MKPLLEAQLHLLPAYGRSYKDAAGIRHAWEHGRDFKVHGPGMEALYANKDDLDQIRAQGIEVLILYGSYNDDAPTLRIETKTVQ